MTSSGIVTPVGSAPGSSSAWMVSPVRVVVAPIVPTTTS
jgi:hypothetical protein